MKKTVLLKPIAVAFLTLTASANSAAWQNGPGQPYPQPYPYNPPQAWGWPQQPPHAFRDSFEARLQNNERRINEMYEELQGAKVLLQQSSEALYRAQIEHQQNAATATQSLSQQQNTSNWEIERLRTLTEKLETQHAALAKELKGKEDVIAELTKELDTARDVEHQREAKFSQQEVELGRLVAELKKAHSQTQQLQADKRTQSTKIVTLTEQLQTSKQLLQQTAAESDQHGQKLVSLQSELQMVREAAHKTKTGVDSQNKKLQTLLIERGQQLASASADLESARTELRTLRLASSESDKTLNEVNEKLASAKAASARMQSLLDQSSATAKQQEEKIASCATNLTRAHSDCKTAQAAQATTTEPTATTPAAIEPATTEPAAIKPTKIEKIPLEVAESPPTPDPQSKTGDSDGDGLSDAVDLCVNTPSGVKVGGSGCKLGASISLQGVKFGYDSDELTSESITLLDHVARVLQQHPNLTHEVAGHTDTQGNAAYNVWLSQRRATSVKNHLISRGIKPTQLVAVGYGGEQPIGDNNTWGGLIKNRRVELRWLP